MISGETIPHGLFGYPVKHTFSPQMHNASFKNLNINGIYLPFQVRPACLKSALDALICLGFNGINITVPHKQNCMKYLDEIDTEAQNIGAVNTIKVEEGKLKGFNTDGRGFIKSLEENNIEIEGDKILVLGAGGASRAINVSLVMEGKIERIYIYDIENEKSIRLTKDINSIIEDSATVLGKNEMREIIKEVDVLINATPVGLEKDESPIEPDLVSPSLKLVYDLIYNPPQTKLLKVAKEKNIRNMNGLEMLVNQGAASFKIWTGVWPVIEVMKEAIPIKSK